MLKHQLLAESCPQGPNPGSQGVSPATASQWSLVSLRSGRKQNWSSKSHRSSATSSSPLGARCPNGDIPKVYVYLLPSPQGPNRRTEGSGTGQIGEAVWGFVELVVTLGNIIFTSTNAQHSKPKTQTNTNKSNNNM